MNGDMGMRGKIVLMIWDGVVGVVMRVMNWLGVRLRMGSGFGVS